MGAGGGYTVDGAPGLQGPFSLHPNSVATRRHHGEMRFPCL